MTPKMTHVGVESAATHRRHNTHADNTERTHKENAPTKNKESPKNAHGENTHTHSTERVREITVITRSWNDSCHLN